MVKVTNKLFVCFILVFFLSGLYLFYNPVVFADSSISFIEIDNLMEVRNNYFEIGFNRNNGGILYIRDNIKGRNMNITDGNSDEILWWAFLSDGDWVESDFYENNFNYKWDPKQNKLTMYYPVGGKYKLGVTIDIVFSTRKWFKARAEVWNKTGESIQTFGFPYQLGIKRGSIFEALLPLLPGVKLDKSFFEDGRSYTAQYPGEIFADFLSLFTSNGKIAIYGQHNNMLQPVVLGYEKSGQNDTYKVIHNYKTWIYPDKKWSSPFVYVRVGEDYKDSINAYREDSGIDRFPGISTKLGRKKGQYFASPLYKLDMELIGYDFNKMKSSIINTLDIPGLLHPVAFQKGGHDLNYPDFLPPAERLGDINDFADFIDYAKTKDNLLVPYTNFSWWDTDGPTLDNLPEDLDINELTVLDKSGINLKENYGPEKDGYVMNLHSSFVRDRIAEEHRKLMDRLKMDGIFEDQFGARSAPYDFNLLVPDEFSPAVSYFEGVLKHAKTHAEDNLMTETGVDMLAEYEVGFMGTNLLWDKLGYREATAEYSHYYPMAGFLLRDKVLFYQHDLAEETWTNNKDMFRWNLAMGYNFSNAFYLNGDLDTENPWLDLVGVFQKYVLSNYADRLVKGYQGVGNGVFETEFEDYKVYTNWNEIDTFTIKDHIIPVGGAVILSDSGRITGGVFKSYNNRLLSEGEHYLVELREKDRIQIFQPVGADTILWIEKNDNWIGAEVKAYQYDGKYITDVNAKADGNRIVFNYKKEISSRQVGYYEIKESNTPNTVLEGIPYRPDLIIKDILWSPGEATAGSELEFSVVVENRGAGATDGGVIHDLSLNLDANKATFWSKSYSESIPPGAVITINIDSGKDKPFWTAVKGEHVLSALIDDYNKIEESNEENNYYLKLLPVANKQSAENTAERHIDKEVSVFKVESDIKKSDSGELYEKYVCNKIDKSVVGSAKSVDDLSGSFGLLWDNRNLYLLADVRDDSKNMNKAQSAWQNDCIELYLDMSGNGGNIYMKDDFQFMFAWNSDRVYETKHNSVDGVSLQTVNTDYGYRIFAEIPWTTLGVTPVDEMEFGIDVAIDDNDSGTRDTQFIWNSSDDQAWQFPERFGKGKLLDEEKVTVSVENNYGGE